VSVEDGAPIYSNIEAGTTVRWQLFLFDGVGNPISLDRSSLEKGFSNIEAKFRHRNEEFSLPQIQVDENNLYYYFDQKLVKEGLVKFTALLNGEEVTGSTVHSV